MEERWARLIRASVRHEESAVGTPTAQVRDPRCAALCGLFLFLCPDPRHAHACLGKNSPITTILLCTHQPTTAVWSITASRASPPPRFVHIYEVRVFSSCVFLGEVRNVVAARTTPGVGFGDRQCYRREILQPHFGGVYSDRRVLPLSAL